MTKRREKGGKKNNIGGIVKLKIVVERLQKSLLLSKAKIFSDNDADESEEMKVPDDVKEGHFAVIAEDDDELKRFTVPLSYLTNPSFLWLLEQAAEEYGFDHQGALTVPCRPSELERILAEERSSRVSGGGSSGGGKWGSCNKTTVGSC